MTTDDLERLSFMLNRLTIVVSGKDPLLFIVCDDQVTCGRRLFGSLIPPDIFHMLQQQATTTCSRCGSFIVNSASFFEATDIDIYVVEELIELSDIDITSIYWDLRQLQVKPVLLSDGEFRDLEARNEPIPDFEDRYEYVYLNEESDPYLLKYDEVLLKLSDDCLSCRSVWKSTYCHNGRDEYA